MIVSLNLCARHWWLLMRCYIFLAVQICNCVTLISELSWELFEQLMFCFLSGNLVHRFTGSSVFTRHSQHSDICSSVRAVCMSSRQKCRYYADTSCFSFSSLFVFFLGLGIGHLIHSAMFPLLFFPLTVTLLINHSVAKTKLSIVADLTSSRCWHGISIFHHSCVAECGWLLA